ncbi:hypothetical protein ALO51_200026 [Pseudomonas amygdali]|nr:hypothetical protein ALO51_200026 [Pseudomonas amygdali]
MPRFLWRVIVRRGENIQMDFLFDATGVAQHNLLMNVVSIACEDRDLIARLAEPEYLEVVNQFPLQARSVIDAFAEADAAEIRDLYESAE